MTIQEFNKTRFASGDRVIYKGKKFVICTLDFEEALIGFDMDLEGAEPETISWVRCENCEYLPTIDIE